MKNIEELLIPENITLETFYPYTSRVREVIYETRYFKTDNHWLRPIWDWFMSKLIQVEEDVRFDTPKSVIKFLLKNEEGEILFLFIGCYDGKISIGYDVEQHITWRGEIINLKQKTI